MKNLLFILLFPALCFSQNTTINNIGTPNIHTQNRGGVGADSIVLLPLRNHNIIFGALRLTGRIQMNSSTLKPEFNNGTSWSYFASESYADNLLIPYRTKAQNDLLYKPFSYTPTKSDVGLSNVDNTSDINKPVSTATQTALNNKPNYTAGNGISITGTAPNLTISVVQPTVTVITSKVLNSNYTISTTKPAIVSYAVTCTVTNPLLVGNSTATAYLEYSLNSGTTWLTPSQNGNSSGVGVTVTLQLTNSQTGTLSGVIPANALVRIRTATTGTASVSYVTGTEITY